jgi:hypothetical protein
MLAVALGSLAVTTDRKARQVEEYPFGSDPFCYLSIAQRIRQGAATGSWPDFTIETPHTRMLIELLQKQPLPQRYWDEMISPLAYHYFPRSNSVGVKCPPGAGLLLASFPQGRALHGLDRVVIGLFVAAGLTILVLAGFKQAWLAAGFVIFALNLGFEVLGRIDNASFSINAMFAPLLLSGLYLAAALGFRNSDRKSIWPVWVLGFIAGLLFGFAILVRLPIALLMPGLMVLLWPSKLRAWYKSALLPFGFGVFLGGVLPELVHQSRLTGAWYVPTYGREDSAPPTLESFWANVSFYFGPGKPGEYNWALLVMLLGCSGLALYSLRRRESSHAKPPSERPGWRRVMIAAVLMWGFPMVYFLTHQVTGHYYALPSLFGTVLLLAVSAFSLESYQPTEGRTGVRAHRLLQWAGLILALAPGLMVIQRAWSNYIPPTAEAVSRRFTLPAELADDRAWVWADIVTGPLWYYARKPSHKINFTNPEMRMLVYKFVIGRGEPQYIIEDGTDMQRMKDEMVKFGAKLERRGEVDGYPYFLIHWPPEGPRKTSDVALLRAGGSDQAQKRCIEFKS